MTIVHFREIVVATKADKRSVPLEKDSREQRTMWQDRREPANCQWPVIIYKG